MIRFRLTRKEKLARKVQKLAPTTRSELEKAALLGAQQVLETAKGFVPVEEGGLRKSGRARLLKPKFFNREKRVRAIVGFNAPHAHLLEFGTAERFHKSGKSTGKGRKIPFLFPAYRLRKRAVKSRLSRGIGKAVKRVANK